MIRTLNGERGVFMISFVTSIKDITPQRTRVVRSFDGKNEFTQSCVSRKASHWGAGIYDSLRK